MSLTQFALHHRPVVYLLLAVSIAVGLLAAGALPRREDPDIQANKVQITALYPGASAEQVEQLVTDRLERELMEIDEIKTVESTTRPGIVVIRATASEQSRDRERLWDVVRKRLADIRSELPREVVAVEVNDRFWEISAFILGVTWDGATDRQRDTLARQLRDRLRRLPDVAQVRLVGEPEEQIHLSLSAQRMARMAITPAQVADAVAGRNVLPESGGSVRLGDARLSIAPTGELRSERDLGSIIVGAPGGTPVYLRDIASISRGFAEPPSSLMRVNGQPAVGLYLTMRKGRNISALGRAVEGELVKLQASWPADARVTVLNDLPQSVARRMGEFFENLAAGLALIFVVMYLFMGLRSALLVGAMLPITVLGTFAAMLVFGRDLQQISIAALIIALGMVVDNSIVVMDNIDRKLAEGLDRTHAAVEGTDELRVPLLTSNLTTIAAFAPILLLSGDVGEFIRDLGIVTSLATLFSLLLNYTVMPLVALHFLDSAAGDRPNAVRRVFLGFVDWLRDALSRLAASGLRRPRLTVCLAALALIAAMAALSQLGTQFFPSAQRSQFAIEIWLPEGRDVRATSRVAARVERILAPLPGVQSFATYIGQGGPRFYYNLSPEPPAANYAQIVVNTRSIDDTTRLVAAVQRAADDTIPEARVTARALEQGPPIGAPVAIRIAGDDLGTLRRLGEQVKAILNSTPGAASVYHDYGDRPLTLRLAIDEEQAARVGLTSADIAAATRMGFDGVTVSYLREGEKQIPIQLRLPAAERGTPQSLGDLYLPAAGGGTVPLRQVASVSLVPGEGRIVRRNHVRTLTVLAFTDGTRLASQILADARHRVARLSLPPGYQISFGGEQEEMDRSFSQMLLILGLSVAATLLIVVWEFNSFRVGMAIMAAVPFGLTGAALGLFLTRQTFGFMAFLGMTALGGVVTNHAIVLFEYALAEQRRGLSLDRALIEAGRKRLRPVLLTVALTIGGLLPQALHGGTLWPPMAWALIGGLLGSMLLTLVVVPSLYRLMAGGRRSGSKTGV